jgi:hypothetical protein
MTNDIYFINLLVFDTSLPRSSSDSSPTFQSAPAFRESRGVALSLTLSALPVRYFEILGSDALLEHIRQIYYLSIIVFSHQAVQLFFVFDLLLKNSQ